MTRLRTGMIAGGSLTAATLALILAFNPLTAFAAVGEEPDPPAATDSSVATSAEDTSNQESNAEAPAATAADITTNATEAPAEVAADTEDADVADDTTADDEASQASVQRVAPVANATNGHNSAAVIAELEEKYSTHNAICYAHTGNSDHGQITNNGSAVTLATFNQSWPGDHWEALFIWGNGPDGTLTYHPSAGTAYYAPKTDAEKVGTVTEWVVCKGETPRTTPPTQTLNCTTLTVDYHHALQNGDHINMTINGSQPVNAYVDLNVAGGYNTLGLRINGHDPIPLTQAQVESGVIVYDYASLLNTTTFTVTFVQTNETDTWPNLECSPPPPTDVCKNIAGDQATVPSGFVQDGEDCVPVPAVCTASTVDASVWSTEDGAPTVGAEGIDFSTPTAADKVNYFGRTLNVPFAGITGGSYTVKNTGGPIVAYDFEVFQNGSSGFATIVFEPYVNGLTGAGTSGDGTFHTYVITPTSLVWNSKIASGEGSQAQPVTLTRMQELIPNATLIRAGLGQGKNNAGSLSTVSNFTDPACGYTEFPKTPIEPVYVTPESPEKSDVCGVDKDTFTLPGAEPNEMVSVTPDGTYEADDLPSEDGVVVITFTPVDGKTVAPPKGDEYEVIDGKAVWTLTYTDEACPTTPPSNPPQPPTTTTSTPPGGLAQTGVNPFGALGAALGLLMIGLMLFPRSRNWLLSLLRRFGAYLGFVQLGRHTA